MSKSGSQQFNSPGFREAFESHSRSSRYRRTMEIAVVTMFAAAFVAGLALLDVPWARIPAGFTKLGEFAVLMLPPDPGSWARFLRYLHALGETVAIAFIGTLVAAILAFPFSFLAAKNVVANRIMHFLARRSFDTIRGIDTLVWALIWVSVVGLGPFAGILALVCSDFGTFGKLFSEATEAADRRPVEGVLSTGGSHLHTVRFGLIPQVLPVLASQVLYYFESNTRSATIIGIVGAGGIGLQLSEQIHTLEWQAVSFLIIMILTAVGLIDFVSSRLRFAIIGKQAVTT